mgnify:FL=1|jgi:hypothetical protein
MNWIKLIKAIIISIPLFVQIGIVIGIFNEDDDISNICSVIFLGEICLLFIVLIIWSIYILI